MATQNGTSPAGWQSCLGRGCRRRSELPKRPSGAFGTRSRCSRRSARPPRLTGGPLVTRLDQVSQRCRLDTSPPRRHDVPRAHDAGAERARCVRVGLSTSYSAHPSCLSPLGSFTRGQCSVPCVAGAGPSFSLITVHRSVSRPLSKCCCCVLALRRCRRRPAHTATQGHTPHDGTCEKDENS